ncbi:MAG: T9SS type A sorting domain-containing protein [Ignavibacteriales bacterium]|nr:T9SS type A sorting domain-containing protein [Ignavibacteriales bacterium]
MKLSRYRGNTLAFVVLSVIMFIPVALSAYPTGIASRTLKITASGCGSCHGSSASPSVVVTITGPDTVVAGQAYSYTINVTGGTGTTGGINIATSRGRLDSVSSFLKRLSGDLVHKQRVAVPSTYQFLYTAPASSGTDTIYATAKGGGFNSWNWMPNKNLVVLLPTNVSDGNLLPAGFSLSQNFPNPFNPITRIQYFISQSKPVELKVYDIDGHEIKRLVSELQQPGDYTVEWDASYVASGIYFYRLTVGNYTETKKMILTR